MRKAFSLSVMMSAIFFAPAGHGLLQKEVAAVRPNVRSILKEAADLAIQVENPYDRITVYERLGEVSWKSGDRVTATESFSKALEVVATLPPQENFYEDPRESYRARIASIRARAGDIEGAQQTLALIKDDSSKSEALINIATSQARSGDFSNAVRSTSVVQDFESRDQSFETIAYNQLEAGDTEGATQLAQRIKNAQYRSEILAAIAATLAEKGHTEEAWRSMQEAFRTAEQAELSEHWGRGSLAGCSSHEPEQPRDRGLESLAEFLVGVGDIAGAVEAISRIHDVAGRENMLASIAEDQARAGDLTGAQASVAAISRDTCKAAALNGVGQGLFDTGNLSTAVMVANSIAVPVERALSLSYFGEQLANKHEFNAALEILRSALEASRLITTDNDRAAVLGGIASAQAQAGSADEAARTLAEAAPLALADYQRAKREHRWSSVFPDLIELEAEIGDFEGALTNLVQVECKGRINIVQNAASRRAKTGDTQGALSWAARQVSPRDKALALTGVADGILSHNEPKKP